MKKINLLMLLVFVGLVSCSSRHEGFECDKQSRDSEYGKVFLTGPQVLNSIHFRDILKMSGIHAEGYTLMITGEKNLEASYIKRFDEMLNFNQLHANHILGIADSGQVSPANRVAVENARLIFLALTSKEYHNAILDDEKFKESFLKAWKSGATIVAVAEGSDIFGDQVVVLQEYERGQKKYALRNGLSMVPGVVIDKSSFFHDEKQWISDNLKGDVTFMGLDEHSMIQVCGSEVVIIEPGSLLISKNNKPVDKSLFQPKAKISLK